jgi:predicted permease
MIDDPLRMTLADETIEEASGVEKKRPSVASQVVRSILLAALLVWASWLVVSWAFDRLGESFFR